MFFSATGQIIDPQKQWFERRSFLTLAYWCQFHGLPIKSTKSDLVHTLLRYQTQTSRSMPRITVRAFAEFVVRYLQTTKQQERNCVFILEEDIAAAEDDTDVAEQQRRAGKHAIDVPVDDGKKSIRIYRKIDERFPIDARAEREQHLVTSAASPVVCASSSPLLTPPLMRAAPAVPFVASVPPSSSSSAALPVPVVEARSCLEHAAGPLPPPIVPSTPDECATHKRKAEDCGDEKERETKRRMPDASAILAHAKNAPLPKRSSGEPGNASASSSSSFSSSSISSSLATAAPIATTPTNAALHPPLLVSIVPRLQPANTPREFVRLPSIVRRQIGPAVLSREGTVIDLTKLTEQAARSQSRRAAASSSSSSAVSLASSSSSSSSSSSVVERPLPPPLNFASWTTTFGGSCSSSSSATASTQQPKVVAVATTSSFASSSSSTTTCLASSSDKAPSGVAAAAADTEYYFWTLDCASYPRSTILAHLTSEIVKHASADEYSFKCASIAGVAFTMYGKNPDAQAQFDYMRYSGELLKDVSRTAHEKTCALSCEDYVSPHLLNLNGRSYSYEHIHNAISKTLLVGEQLRLEDITILPTQIECIQLYPNHSLGGWTPRKYTEQMMQLKVFSRERAERYNIPAFSAWLDAIAGDRNQVWDESVVDLYKNKYCKSRPDQNPAPCDYSNPPVFTNLLIKEVVFPRVHPKHPVHFVNVEFCQCVIYYECFCGPRFYSCRFVDCWVVLGNIFRPGVWRRCSFERCFFFSHRKPLGVPSELVEAGGVFTEASLLLMQPDVLTEKLVKELPINEIHRRINVACGLADARPEDQFVKRRLCAGCGTRWTNEEPVDVMCAWCEDEKKKKGKK